MASNDSVSVTIEIPQSELPRAESANWFHFTVSGPEFEMLVGTLSLHELHLIRTGVKKPKVRPDISHRFFLSLRGFIVLKRQVDELTAKLEAQNPNFGRAMREDIHG